MKFQLGEEEVGGGFLPVNLLGKVEALEDSCLSVVRIYLFDLGKIQSCSSAWQREFVSEERNFGAGFRSCGRG